MPDAIMSAHEKTPLSSKKFLAFIVSEVTWKIVMAMGLWMLRGHLSDATAWVWWWMMTATICVTFLEVGTILGLAYVDRFVRVAAITASGPGGDKKEDAKKLLMEDGDVGKG